MAVGFRVSMHTHTSLRIHLQGMPVMVTRGFNGRPTQITLYRDQLRLSPVFHPRYLLLWYISSSKFHSFVNIVSPDSSWSPFSFAFLKVLTSLFFLANLSNAFFFVFQPYQLFFLYVHVSSIFFILSGLDIRQLLPPPSFCQHLVVGGCTFTLFMYTLK